MKVRYGYRCRKCGKLYPYSKYGIPFFCKKCGADLIKYRRNYSYMPITGEKTYDTNVFGGYDDCEAEVTEYAEKVKLFKKYPFSKWRILIE